jgi:hypothetical protein
LWSTEQSWGATGLRHLVVALKIMVKCQLDTAVCAPSSAAHQIIKGVFSS